jgi:hypothetical protein
MKPGKRSETIPDNNLLMLQSGFVRNSEFLSALSPAGGQHPAAICRSHSFAETVLVFSLSLGRLKGTYHNKSNFSLKMRAAKMASIFRINNNRP